MSNLCPEVDPLLKPGYYSNCYNKIIQLTFRQLYYDNLPAEPVFSLLTAAYPEILMLDRYKLQDLGRKLIAYGRLLDVLNSLTVNNQTEINVEIPRPSLWATNIQIQDVALTYLQGSASVAQIASPRYHTVTLKAATIEQRNAKLQRIIESILKGSVVAFDLIARRKY